MRISAIVLAAMTVVALPVAPVSAAGSGDDLRSESGPDSWSARAPLPSARKGAVAAALDGLIYLFGDAETKGSASVYDPAGDRWSSLATMPQPRWSPAVAALDGEVYVVSGGDFPPTRAFPEVFKYAPGSGWSAAPPIPTPRFQASAVSIGGKLYVIGGSDRVTWMSTVEVYDPQSGWSTAPSMPTGRAAPAAAVIDGKIYVTGGRDRSSNTFATVEAFDPRSGTWSTVADMGTPRRGHGAAALGGRLYVFGGCNGALRGEENETDALCGRYLTENEEFDPATGGWTPRAPLPGSRAYFGFGGTAEAAYVFGGEGNVTGAETSRYEPPTPPVLDRAEIDPPSAVLTPGETADLRGRALDPALAEISAANLSWSVAGDAGTISGSSGAVIRFHADKPGTATVKLVATYRGMSKDASAAITVIETPIARVTVEPDSYELPQGEIARFVASAYDAAGDVLDATFTWSVVEPAVAELNTTTGRFALVTAVAPGKTGITIRAERANSWGEAEAEVTVVPPADGFPPSVTIETPASGASVRSEFTVRGSSAPGAGGPGITRVEARFDGGDWIGADGTATWSLAVDPAALGWTAGTHVVEARSYDGLLHSSIVRIEVVFRPAPADGSGPQTGDATSPALGMWATFLLIALAAAVAGGAALSRRRRVRRV